jgi:hypothetical protein
VPRRPALDDLAATLRRAWHADTAWIDDWQPEAPARGQCGSTALVLNDLRGGQLMRGLVDEGGRDLTLHYWNTLDLGQIDLTWMQFPPSARLVHGERVLRSDLLTSSWLETRYRTLRDRVGPAETSRRGGPAAA